MPATDPRAPPAREHTIWDFEGRAQDDARVRVPACLSVLPVLYIQVCLRNSQAKNGGGRASVRVSPV